MKHFVRTFRYVIVMDGLQMYLTIQSKAKQKSNKTQINSFANHIMLR